MRIAKNIANIVAKNISQKIPKNISKKWLIAAAATMLLSGLAWTAFSRPTSSVGGHWQSVAPGEAAEMLSLKGTLQPATMVSLTAPFDGRIAERLVEYGETVKAGQKLARIESPDLEQQLRDAQIAVLRAEQDLRNARELERGADYMTAQRRLGLARKTAAAAQRRAKETKSLYDSGIVARQELDMVQQEVATTSVDVDSAQGEIAALRQRNSGVALQVLELEAKNRQAVLQQLRTRSEAAVIVAPAPGVVMPRSPSDSADSSTGGTSKEMKTGSFVSHRDTLFVIGGTQEFIVKAPVEETDAAAIKAGQKASVSLKANPGQVYEGTVKRITWQARDPNQGGGMPAPTFEVQVQVQSPELGARATSVAAAANVNIQLNRERPSIVVPLASLTWDAQGQPVVTVRKASSGAGQPRKITVARTTVNAAMVESGLEAGEEVWVPQSGKKEGGEE